MRLCLFSIAAGVAASLLGGGAARAACAPSLQTIARPVTGPVLANGGAIAVTAAGTIAGKPDGVDALGCPITALTNRGAINGGSGVGANGGVGVSSSRTIATFSNSARIVGGAGGAGSAAHPFGYDGGAGLLNAAGATITSLTNASGGLIAGGGGGNGAGMAHPGSGAFGLWNAGTIATLTNAGVIEGGILGGGYGGGAYGSFSLLSSGSIGTLTNSGQMTFGVSNTGAIRTLTNRGAIGRAVTSTATVPGLHEGLVNAGTIVTLTNSGSVIGSPGTRLNGSIGGSATAGHAGVSNSGTIASLTSSGRIIGGDGGRTSSGGAGVSNSATIGSLTSSGEIDGGAAYGGISATNGAGVSNTGRIATLSNSGRIQGGVANSAGAPPRGPAILSAGAKASIGRIVNSGQLVGDVEIDNQASVTVAGGTGRTFGRWSGGTIRVGAGSLAFTGGNTDLADAIVVNGGAGKVTNSGALRLAGKETVDGGFVQTAAGTFDAEIAGAAAGRYGALTATKLMTLDGRLSVDLAGGFTLAAGEHFGLFSAAGLTFTSPTGDFRSLTFEGVGCGRQGARLWSCSNLKGLRFAETISATAFVLDVVAAAVPGTAIALDLPTGGRSGPVPEPSTWLLIAAGFVALAGFSGRRAATRGASRAAWRTQSGAWTGAERGTRWRSRPVHGWASATASSSSTPRPGASGGMT